MKINALICFVLCTLFLSPIDQKTMIEIRNLYEQAAQNKTANQKLSAMLTNIAPNDVLLMGYKGASIMMEAKHVVNPFTKMSKFKKGKNLIEDAIKNDANNTELRYVRLTIQTNLPAFLGYDEAIKNDKTFLIEHLPSLKDTDLKNRIVKYLSNKKICNEDELTRIVQWKSK